MQHIFVGISSFKVEPVWLPWILNISILLHLCWPRSQEIERDGFNTPDINLQNHTSITLDSLTLGFFVNYKAKGNSFSYQSLCRSVLIFHGSTLFIKMFLS